MLKPKEEEVFNYVVSHGPCTPTDVSKALGMSSILSSAILASLASNNYIKMTKMKYGSSQLYYYKGQEEKVRSILYSILSPLQKKVIERLKRERIILDENVSPQERLFLRELPDFAGYLEVSVDSLNKRIWCYWNVTNDEIKEFFEKRRKEKNKVKEEVKEKKESKKEEKEIGNFVKFVLEKFNFNIKKEKIGKKQAELLVEIKNDFGKEEVIVLIKEKASLNDLIKLYLKSLEKKKRIYLITRSNLKNKFKEFIEVITI